MHGLPEPLTSSRQHGFTLIEVMITIVVLGGMLLGIYSVFAGGTDTYALGVLKADLERRSSRAINLIADAISASGATSIFPQILPPNSAGGIGYQCALGYSGSAVQWGPLTLIVADYDVNDPNDGVDNDGDGLVDEMILIRRENPGAANEARVVILRGVSEYLEGERPNGTDDNGNGLIDERGLCITVENGIYTIRLTVVGKDSRGRQIFHTVETSVTPRN